METLNICLMDMTQSTNTSGVDRYLQNLVKGLADSPNIHVVWIRFMESNRQVFVKKEVVESGIRRVTIPLPRFVSGILEDMYWIRQYDERVFRIIADCLPNDRHWLIHLHTLNLIDLGIYLRDRLTHCTVIMHMHCIPWKSLYNTNRRHFNALYDVYYNKNIPQEKRKAKPYMRLESEYRAYHDADHVVCVTQCAKDFLANWMGRSERVHVIPNGFEDVPFHSHDVRTTNTRTGVHCLYVGVLSESKGLHYILEALEKLRIQGRRTTLTVCGSCPPTAEKTLKQMYRHLELDIRGLVTYDTLQQLYLSCDIGLIASLQEQSSMVAIEMMRHGLPIVTTAVDGLDEMFHDGVDSLKVHTCFSPVLGLSVDVDEMAEKIASLINSPSLRKRIGNGARHNYEKRFTLSRMLEDTLKIYHIIANNKSISNA